MRRSRPADCFHPRSSVYEPGLRSIAMRALLVTGIVVILLLIPSMSAASVTSARAARPVTCGPAATPTAPTTAPTPGLVVSPASAPPVVLQAIDDIPLPGPATRFDYQSLNE